MHSNRAATKKTLLREQEIVRYEAAEMLKWGRTLRTQLCQSTAKFRETSQEREGLGVFLRRLGEASYTKPPEGTLLATLLGRYAVTHDRVWGRWWVDSFAATVTRPTTPQAAQCVYVS